MCIRDRQKAFAKAQVDAGADFIGVGNAVASLIGPSLYEEYAFAYDKAIVDYVHSLGAKVKLHICGNITALLPQLREVAPDILDLDWMVDYKTAADMMPVSYTHLAQPFTKLPAPFFQHFRIFHMG